MFNLVRVAHIGNDAQFTHNFQTGNKCIRPPCSLGNSKLKYKVIDEIVVISITICRYVVQTILQDF